MNSSITTQNTIIKKEAVEKVINWATREFWCVTLSLMLCSIVGGLIYSVVRDHMGWGVNDSDKNGRNRSGMHVFTDHKTGIQYLASPHGGITPRLDRNGNWMIADE